jgi:hypothetical protein
MHNELGTILHCPEVVRCLARSLCEVEPSLRQRKQEHLFGLGAGVDFYGEMLSHVDQDCEQMHPGCPCVNAGIETKATS